MIDDSGEHQLAIALRLDVHEGSSEDTQARTRLTFERRLLQYVLTETRLMLRIGIRMTQPLDTNFEEQLVLVEQGCMGCAEWLITGQRHPVERVCGEQVIPLVEALLVDEAGFAINQLDG